jgi:hypothetical protein
MTTLIATDAAHMAMVVENLRKWMRHRDAVLIAVSGGIDTRSCRWRIAQMASARSRSRLFQHRSLWERDQLPPCRRDRWPTSHGRDSELGTRLRRESANRCYFCKVAFDRTAPNRAERIDHILDG